MSIIDKETLDGIAINADGDSIRLFLSDHLDWNEEYTHLLMLQEKINSYIMFCENQQYKDIYKDLFVKYVIIEIHFLFEPTEAAVCFLDQVNRQLNEIGIFVEWKISEGD